MLTDCRLANSIVHRIGLIVNPVAGVGGSTALKGSDGANAALSLAMGAVSEATPRTVNALKQLRESPFGVEIVTCSGQMGEVAAVAAGFAPRIVYWLDSFSTSAQDTRAGLALILKERIELLLFAGGDGTARDILAAGGATVPCIGIPTGVKMHSAVFGVTPKAAGDVAKRYLLSSQRNAMLHLAEVMDRPEGESECSSASAHFYGHLCVPRAPMLVQGPKSSYALGSTEALDAACARVASDARRADLAIIGPGTTMQRVKSLLDIDGSLLGVDVFSRGRCIAKDVNELEILRLLDRQPAPAATIVVSVVGGQGFLFGRGNQQISARVLSRVGRDAIVVVASMEKLVMLPEGVLRIDTGDEAVNDVLSGYIPVWVAARQQMLCRVVGTSD